ncbi:MAG: DUF4347 domain-containing protein, partial [Gammaproteobacteria bacterium]
MKSKRPEGKAKKTVISVKKFLIAVCAIVLPLTVFANTSHATYVSNESASIQGAETLVIIDTSVEHVLDLLPGIDPEAKVVLLDTRRDPVAQVTEILARHKGLSSLHIISHGGSGRLYLGTTELNMKNLSTYEKTLTSWSRSLSIGADVFLYGCEVARGDGEKFVRAFGKMIGADVAASDDVTASSTNGGDWEFEVVTGVISANRLIKPAVAEASNVELALPAGFTNELVIQNLDQPVSMTLLPSNEMLVLERTGRILIMDPTQAVPSATVYLQLPNVDASGEKGLLDIALDADFANNKYFYVYYHNS